jgi:cadmium resistance protein CadD (predicted permease)
MPWSKVFNDVTAFEWGIMVYTFAILMLYERLNPNMDVERKLYERNRVCYHLVKYSRWLIRIVMIMYAYYIFNKVLLATTAFMSA